MGRATFRLLIFACALMLAASAFAQSDNQVAKGTTSRTPAPSTSKPAAKPVSTPLVDLNTASKKALMELPGITDANAQKIIENRPYRTTSELTVKNVLPRDAYEKIASRIVARTTTRVSPGNGEKRAASSKGQSEVERKYQ